MGTMIEISSSIEPEKNEGSPNTNNKMFVRQQILKALQKENQINLGMGFYNKNVKLKGGLL